MRLRSAAIALGWIAATAACGASTEGARPPAPLASTTLSGARLDVHEIPGKPRLVSLARDGDPVSSLGAVARAPGDPEALATLADVVRARLASRSARVHVAAEALLVSIDVDDTPAAALAALTSALTLPIQAAEESRAAAKRSPLPRASTEALASALACSGRLASGPKTAPYAPGRAEALRARAVTHETVALGLVGPDATADAMATALDGAESWPAAASADAEARAAALQSSASAAADIKAGLRLRVAFRSATPAGAVAAAHRLGEARRPIHALASDAGLKLSEIVGAATPSGGCVALTLGSAPKASLQSGATAADAGRELASRAESTPDPNALARLVRALGSELAMEVAEPAPEDLAAREVVSAKDPADAAVLAAWWALAKDGRGSFLSAVSVELAADADASRVAAFEAAVSRPTADPKPTAPIAAVTRVERGQRDVWVLIADPCAAAEEPAHLWGSAAMAVRAAVPLTSEHEGEIRPYLSPTGIGFVARATPLAAETPAQTARRAADLAASSFFAEPASTESLLRAQESARREVELSWGRGAPGLQPHAEAAIDPPSVFEPFGPPADSAKRGAWELSRRLRALAHDPLKVVVIAQEDDAQARAAVDEAARWFGAGSSRPCVRPAPTTAPRKTEVKGPRGPSRAHLTLPPADPALVAFTADLLTGPDGVLGKALAPVAGARAAARTIAAPGGTLLAIDVIAPPEGIDESVRLVSELVGRLGRGEIPDAELTTAARRHARAERERLGDPAVRLGRLFDGASPTPLPAPTTQAFRAFASRALVAERLVVTIARPE